MSPLAIAFLVCLCLPVALLAAASIRAQRDEARHVVRVGRLAEAEVLGVERTEDGVFVDYRFIPDGATVPVTCTRAARSRKAARLQPGQRLPVRYLPKTPAISVLVSQSGGALTMPC